MTLYIDGLKISEITFLGKKIFSDIIEELYYSKPLDLYVICYARNIDSSKVFNILNKDYAMFWLNDLYDNNGFKNK
jgi:hypothetical protein